MEVRDAGDARSADYPRKVVCAFSYLVCVVRKALLDRRTILIGSDQFRVSVVSTYRTEISILQRGFKVPLRNGRWVAI